VQAFLRAFRPGEASLTLKMSPTTQLTAYPSVDEVIEEELLHPDVLANGWRKHPVARGDIRILRTRLSKEEMVRLHAEHDVYVVPSHGEGLELGSYAAKLAGRRIVSTACGGPEDFLDPESDLLVPSTGLVPAAEEYDWGEGAAYVDYDLAALVEALQRARGLPAGGSRRWPGMEEHRAPAVGRCMRQWVEGMCSR
jgi:glycosyltransferase involved in cell wall biosynthesis